MKKIYLILLLVIQVISSCDGYLDIVPDNVATIEYAFRNRVGAEKFLATCYSYLPEFGDPGWDPAIMGSDEIWIHGEENTYSSNLGGFHAYRIKRGQQNVSSPLTNYWEGSNRGKNLFMAIRDCNIFLENIDLVKTDLEDIEKERWIAEVKFLKAFYHYYLMKLYGPIPLMKENISIDAETDKVRVFRDPFDECVEYVAELIDEAVPYLPLEINNITSEQGRITQPIALAIKAELLVTAASPLFNGNTAYANFVDSKGRKLINTEFDESKWERAMNACKNAIDTALLAQKLLFEFTDIRYPVSDETKRIMSLRNAFCEKWNSETIWGIPDNTMGLLQRYSLPYFTPDDIRLMHTDPIMSTPLHIVETFYSNNGVPIDEDLNYDYANRYKTSIVTDQTYYIKNGHETANLNINREPRFYANLGFDGGVWFGNGRYKDIGNGTATETSWIVEARQGQTSGKSQSIRYSATGYFLKKYTHFLTVTTSNGVTYNRMAFPVIRLADLFLLYAEARNEFSGPDETVYNYIDQVRARAGLKGVVESWSLYSKNPNKPTTKEGLRRIIQQERMIELCFEGKRFWDIRRWKTADQILNQHIKGWNVEKRDVTEYYNPVTLEVLKFQMKEYLWPISEQALRVNPNLIQNPFWNN